jgi:hypothetical protein
MSLKAYARSLASMRASHPTGAADASRWFASKKPVHKKQHVGPHGRGSWSK